MGYTLARLELSLENNFNNADHTKTLSVRELYIYIYIYICRKKIFSAMTQYAIRLFRSFPENKGQVISKMVFEIGFVFGL